MLNTRQSIHYFYKLVNRKCKKNQKNFLVLLLHFSVVYYIKIHVQSLLNFYINKAGNDLEVYKRMNPLWSEQRGSIAPASGNNNERAAGWLCSPSQWESYSDTLDYKGYNSMYAGKNGSKTGYWWLASTSYYYTYSMCYIDGSSASLVTNYFDNMNGVSPLVSLKSGIPVQVEE